MSMPDFYDEIKFLNSDWGTPKTPKIIPKWETETSEVIEEYGKYITKNTGSLYYPSLKGTLQCISTTTTVPTSSGKLTTFAEQLRWIKDK